MTPEGKRLHDFLTTAIEQGRAMPEIGAKNMAEGLRVQLPDLKGIADALKLRAAAAITGYKTEAKRVEKALGVIEDHTDSMRNLANELIGNQPAESEK